MAPSPNHIELLASGRFLLIREVVASHPSSFVLAVPGQSCICCFVEGVLTDFVGGSLAEAGHARSEEPNRT